MVRISYLRKQSKTRTNEQAEPKTASHAYSTFFSLLSSTSTHFLGNNPSLVQPLRHSLSPSHLGLTSTLRSGSSLLMTATISRESLEGMEEVKGQRAQVNWSVDGSRGGSGADVVELDGF
jgi:hypothetical protein